MRVSEMRPIEREPLLHIAQNMRPWDRVEIMATRPNEDLEGMCDGILAMSEFAGIAWRDGKPIAAIGAMSFWHGVWHPWCFGTEAFRTVSILLTRFGQRAIIPAVKAQGGRRMEVRSIEGHLDAQAWLERAFGATREATHPAFGKGGETFHTYSVVF